MSCKRGGLEYADFGLFSGCNRHIMELIAAGSRQLKQLIDIKQRQPVQAQRGGKNE